MLCLNMFSESEVAFAFFRASQNDRDMLEQDFCEVLNNYDVDYAVNSKKNYVRVGNHKVRIYGLNSTSTKKTAKKAGLPRFGNVKYVYIFFEERYEFSQDDISFIKQAVRSTNPNTQILYLSACNP